MIVEGSISVSVQGWIFAEGGRSRDPELWPNQKAAAQAHSDDSESTLTTGRATRYLRPLSPLPGHLGVSEFKEPPTFPAPSGIENTTNFCT